MYISSVKLRNYRNYESQVIGFEKGMNIIVGNNGEGKTNLLESIYLLSTTRSHRIDDNKELILFDKEFGSVEGTVISGENRFKLSVVVLGNTTLPFQSASSSLISFGSIFIYGLPLPRK